MDLLSNAEKEELGLPLLDIHDTWKKPIAMWKTAKQVVISTNPNHNFIFDSNPLNSEIQEVPVSGVFRARVLYGDKQGKEQFSSLQRQGSEDQLGIEKDAGLVRIKVDASGAAFLEGAQRVTFDGNIFVVETSPRPHGLFATQFYTFYLQRVN